ncbi:NAD-dependent epimerase/dehydratase family protein [Streptomyces sp. 549]|uniref:NAD-dependent epimerase/dehydratase family protein n=1 Tax=Streptomyces sp. 549 TaxID=3049076 RepID=UPI0024C464B4|nr:NAD-dependent epimerase/dehydratase family protein [Streptomyces sp. 549]MDK1476540.1 NAD-dependent epimerase/dehydratase family protein [Streptomyces sp. 549]
MAGICVIGGTRFFGKLLVRRLIDEGHQITLVTRGRAGDPFGSAVRRLHADVNQPGQLATAVKGERFDTVIHQACYTPNAALDACAAFGKRAGRFVLTSSMEVYNAETFRHQTPAPPMSAFAREDELRPEQGEYDAGLPWDDLDFVGRNYGEGKRQAESALVRNADVPVTVARVAHVLAAADDFTGRLRFHVDRARAGEPVTVHTRPGRTSLVHAPDVAAALSRAATSDLAGVVNVASPDPANVYDVCAAVDRATGRDTLVVERDSPGGDPALSPYSCATDFGMDTARAVSLGFDLAPVSRWLPEIARIAAQESS